MTRIPRKIFSARWTSPSTGIVSLTRDWNRAEPPPLYWEENGLLENLHKAPPMAFGDESGYFSNGGWVTFCLRASRYPNFDLARSGVYVAGAFNEWQPGFGHRMWRLDAAIVQGQEYYLLNVQKDLCLSRGKTPFKFITGRGEWMEVPSGAPNITVDESGNHNLYIHPFRTGHHQFFFKPPSPIGRTHGTGRVEWREDGYTESVLMMPGEYLHSVDSDCAQGARIVDGATVFHLFAPRAASVKLELFRKIDKSDAVIHEASRVDMGSWEVSVPGNWHGAFYFYYVDGEPDPFSHFDSTRPILDPWALACAGPEGPALVIDEAQVARPAKRFEPPQWQDLVIAEAHVRDLVANAPIRISADERLGFTGLAKWVRSPEFPLAKLGINAVELQPVQQNDEPTREGYHWGYMTNSYFAPNSHYALRPQDGSQIAELQDAVAAFHERGIAVLLDVVYNHVGEPNFLQYIDKHYYFDLAADGKYMNWSGCGNTLSCATPMALKLMIQSLSWLVEAYDVDGFRFDLAELVGVEPLRLVERELKRRKSSLILIAEPWSYRGNIALALKDTGFASWNDGYREYVLKYLLGQEGATGLKYFLFGSLDHLSAWPAQSVNYVESHDDMCWMDRVTENPSHSALLPTPSDRRRTHMMCALLMMSLGIPMLSAGQDFLRSKLGNHNTYKQGEVNALDYRRLRYFSGTHEYFRRWIAFRKSRCGSLLRLWRRPNSAYMRFFPAPENSPALGVLVNADGTLGHGRIFFAVNPSPVAVALDVAGLALDRFTQIADTETFDEKGLAGAQRLPVAGDSVEIPPLSCALWTL